MPDRRQVMFGAASLGLLAVTGRARAALPVQTPGDHDRIVDQFLKEQPDFQGAILLGSDGRPGWSRTVGFADIEARRPVMPDTVFAIASVSKWLSSVAVLKLAEQGRLSLDAPVTTWLPYYRADTGARLTLRRLLSNTSGLPNLYSPAAKADPGLLTLQMPADEAVRRFCQGDLVFEPGSRFDYAFTNWIVVLAVIEAVAAAPFPQALRQLVLDPLGLGATHAAGTPDAAISYSAISPPVRRPNDRLPVMAAAGGCFSTAPDLLRAAHGVYDTPFLAPASLQALAHIEVPEQDYALGGRVRLLKIAGSTYPAAWQTGRTAGYRSVLGHRFDTRSTVVVLNNTDMPQPVMNQLAERLFGVDAAA
jgi:CubicO group peptidase (beta-lactamase class C family)